MYSAGNNCSSIDITTLPAGDGSGKHHRKASSGNNSFLFMQDPMVLHSIDHDYNITRISSTEMVNSSSSGLVNLSNSSAILDDSCGCISTIAPTPTATPTIITTPTPTATTAALDESDGE